MGGDESILKDVFEQINAGYMNKDKVALFGKVSPLSFSSSFRLLLLLLLLITLLLIFLHSFSSLSSGLLHVG